MFLLVQLSALKVIWWWFEVVLNRFFCVVSTFMGLKAEDLLVTKEFEGVKRTLQDLKTIAFYAVLLPGFSPSRTSSSPDSHLCLRGFLVFC